MLGRELLEAVAGVCVVGGGGGGVGAQAAGGGVESSGALALSPRFFFLVVKISKMSCKNLSSLLSEVAASLTCRMWDSIISSIRLVKVLGKSR